MKKRNSLVVVCMLALLMSVGVIFIAYSTVVHSEQSLTQCIANNTGISAHSMASSGIQPDMSEPIIDDSETNREDEGFSGFMELFQLGKLAIHATIIFILLISLLIVLVIGIIIACIVRSSRKEKYYFPSEKDLKKEQKLINSIKIRYRNQ